MRHGVSTPTALVERAVSLGQQALALTDRDGVYGAVRFAQACQAAGVAPILGVDLALQPDCSTTRRHRTPARGGAVVAEPPHRVVVLARSARGWAAVCRMVSAAHLRGERGAPMLPQESVVEYASDGEVVVLLGADSPAGHAAAGRRRDLADAEIRWWRDRLGPGGVRVEVCSHRERDTDAVGIADLVGAPRAVRSGGSAARLLRAGIDAGVGAVLSNAVRYADPAGAPVADVLDAIRRLVPISRRHLDRSNAQGYLKGWSELSPAVSEVVRMAGPGVPGVHQLLDDTVALAAECVLDPVADVGLGDVHVPELDVVTGGAPAEVAADVRSILAGYSGRRRSHNRIDAEARKAQVALQQRCRSALGVRYGDSRAAADRLDDELATIAELGFAGYFLTVAEVVDLIREMGVRAAARGSGAGSIVTYLLGISGVDPLAHGLLMERFLSPLRRSLPDIDVDVESARRTEVYEQILARFGGERCACVSMRETYRVRHAVRDVGGALGMPPGDVAAFAKAFPHIRAAHVRDALDDLPELRRSELGQRAAAGEMEMFLDLVAALDGIPRHIAVHPCGVLLSDATMLDRTPVEASWMGFPMSQFDKDEVEALGFLKLDVLGIRMQSAMQHAVAEVGRVDGVDIDLDALPFDDPETFDLIRSTRTLGCFQIESPGQRELLGKFAPETFDDIIIDISLFRPGPVKSDMISPFLAARHGWRPAEFLHEDLRPALTETCGVVVYHEQVLRIVAVMTGCSLAEADEVRRSLGSPDGQQQIRGWFYRCAHERGYDLPTVESVWEVLRAFGSFGFCKAHAAAFAVPTYHSAWLKAHHPAAFLAGVLTHDPGMYPKRLILDDARQFGVTILPLDVNASRAQYRVEQVAGGYGIRVALGEITGISAAEIERIESGQPFSDVRDLWQRAQLSRPVTEGLVTVGALDPLYGLGVPGGVSRLTRRDLLLQVADLDRTGPRRRARPAGQRQAKTGGRDRPAELDPVQAAGGQDRRPATPAASAGRQLAIDVTESIDLTGASGLPEFSALEQVEAELAVLGLDATRHLMDFYAPMLNALGVTRAKDLLATRSRREILVAGVKVATQTPPIRTGHRVVFLSVDDGSGPIDTTFFPDAQEAYAHTVFDSWLLLVRGVVRRTGERGVSLRATGCWELGAVQQVWEGGGMDAVQALLRESPRPGEPGAAAGQHAGRVLVYASGFRRSPYADVRPAGSTAAPAKLWHSSPGSSGW